jgi:hypothetical protein
MHQVDRVEHWILEQICISKAIIFNNNRSNKVLINKMLLVALEIGNQSNSLNPHQELEWIKD